MQFLSLYFVAVATATAMSCDIIKEGSHGFVANFYRYNLRSQRGWSSKFFAGDYLKGGIKTTVPGVVNSNFRHKAANQKVVLGSIYGHKISISNYTIELTGFLTLKDTGEHLFTLKSDNGAALQIYPGISCCNNPHGDKYGNYQMGARDKRGGGGKIDDIQANSTFFLEAGVPYFIRVVTFNWQGNGGLDLSFVSPTGDNIHDLGQLIYQHEYDTTKCLSVTSKNTTIMANLSATATPSIMAIEHMEWRNQPIVAALESSVSTSSIPNPKRTVKRTSLTKTSDSSTSYTTRTITITSYDNQRSLPSILVADPSLTSSKSSNGTSMSASKESSRSGSVDSTVTIVAHMVEEITISIHRTSSKQERKSGTKTTSSTITTTVAEPAYSTTSTTVAVTLSVTKYQKGAGISSTTRTVKTTVTAANKNNTSVVPFASTYQNIGMNQEISVTNQTLSVFVLLLCCLWA